MADTPANVSLPPPADGGVDVLFVAGEHSGDQHAARLARQLQTRHPGIRLAALGGPELARAGVQLLHDLTDSSVVGLVEVLKHYGYFKALFDNTAAWVSKYRPKAVCFVDYPGFNLRLAQRFFDDGISRKGGGDVALFFYISPQIWAWKAKRRFKMARLLDALGVIFPFEVDCYADTELPARFVGHPYVTDGHESLIHYEPDGPLLLLPGSRVQPVTRILPVMLRAFEALLKKRPQQQALILYPGPTVKGLVESILAQFPRAKQNVSLQPASEPCGAAACLISSGTISLSCALAGLPGAICYRAHPMTYAMGRMLVKVPYLGIANLLLPDDPPYKEYIQGAAKPDALAAELEDALANPARHKAAADAAARLQEKLSATTAEDAASWLLEFVTKS